VKFDDLLRAYPPDVGQAKWARVESLVNLDASGESDLDFMSLDPWRRPASTDNCLPHTSTASPLRWIMEHRSMLVPVKAWFEECEALITSITYVAEEPRDYWANSGYSVTMDLALSKMTDYFPIAAC